MPHLAHLLRCMIWTAVGGKADQSRTSPRGVQKMSETFSVELYRQEGDNFRSLRLSVNADGSVRLDAQDMSSFVVWGDSDYEFWVDVPATALRKLTFTLLREKYAGRSGAVDKFSKFCKREGIEHEWDSYV